jgi:hypothetical protein
MAFCTSINVLCQNSLAGLTQLESSTWNLAWSMRLLGDLVVVRILGVVDRNLDPSRLPSLRQWLKSGSRLVANPSSYITQQHCSLTLSSTLSENTCWNLLDLAQTLKRKPVVVLLLTIVLVALDLVAREFVPVLPQCIVDCCTGTYCHRKRHGWCRLFECQRVCYVVVACFC